ncbi:MAG: transglycosylase domain-containing protein [Cyclobacteriaceae bacterium]|nr:transglycosylase domain-containing protein [Cyclobacteriaceae bacterium]
MKNTTVQKIREWVALKHPIFKSIIKTIWILFFCFIIGFPLYIYSVSIDLFGLFGGMPSLKAIENPENDLSSELISADGVSLGRYFRYNRSQVAYENLSDDLINTLILSEDHRFYQHSGMDFIAYLRVLKGLLTFSPAGGGSTITQQLAKNLYTQNPDLGLDGTIGQLGKYPRRIIQKTKEWIIAYHLEKNFTKEEIIALYLNTAEFGSNAYGIQVAAETYFSKSPDSLNVQESAVLVGMLQAITRFNPVLNPDNALAKRNEVLGKLFRHGYIKTSEELDSIRALPIVLQYRVQNQNEGLATYFRSVIGQELMAWCKERGIDLWESGLKIYTTIDSRMQLYAEEAVQQHMKVQQQDFELHWKGKNPWLDDNGNEIKGFLDSRIKQTDVYKALVSRYGANSDSVKIMLNLKKPMRIFTWNGERDTLFSSMDSLNYYKRFLHTGMIAIDANTGAIKAWVGGINHKYFKYDHVKQGKRQPGSTFKPFVYGTAIEAGFTPCFKLQDISPTFKVPGGTWSPPNAEGDYGKGQWLTLRQAMAQSKNSITAQLMQKVGPENVVKFAERVGIQSPLDAVPSLCLGVSDVSLYEMVGAYSTFVNSGIYTEPYFIQRIEDKNGNVIENFVPKTREAISEQTAYKMVYMLQGGIEEEGGTSRGLSQEVKIDNEIGGKTGTTNNASDGWYVGVTHNLVTGVWVGGDERGIHYRTWSMGQGSRTARPIWDLFMRKVYTDQSIDYKKGLFQRPKTGLDITLDCAKYPGADTLEVVDEKPWDDFN